MQFTMKCGQMRIQGTKPLRLAVSPSSPTVPRPRTIVQANPKHKEQQQTEEVTGIVFKPFEEAQLKTVEHDLEPSASFVRMHFPPKAEAALNEQINVEYNISYVYHAMSAYFNRDSVGLPGFAKHFKDESDNERSHAQKLIDFQNTRGGRVKLLAITPPEMEFSNEERGDAQYAMELALSLERLNYDKLLHLWGVFEKEADAQATHFLEAMLEDQVQDIKEAADYVSQLRRLGKGHGVWHMDKEFYNGDQRYMAYTLDGA